MLILTFFFLTSGDDDDEEDSAKKEEREKKRQEEEESLFHRLEESRLLLEQELGFDKFLRVYKYLQVQKPARLIEVCLSVRGGSF